MGICHDESQVSFCAICAGDNVAFVAAGSSICNHIKKTSGDIFITSQLYFIFLSYYFLGTEIWGYS